MKFHRKHLLAVSLLAGLAGTAHADQHLDTLTTGGITYSNVTVTSVSATDIFFTHAHGLGNAKLKNLDPALQQQFHFNPEKAAAAAQKQAQANSKFHDVLVHQPPPKPPKAEEPAAKPAEEKDFVAPKLYAKSVRGQPAPELVVEHWLTDQPNTQGKFVLIDFWATWCGPCRQSIPGLNEFAARFKDRLVVIGISSEPEAAIRKMASPHIDYAVANDPRKRMAGGLKITGIPHCILVDPQGIVRYEGMPTYLNDDILQHFLDKYGR